MERAEEKSRAKRERREGARGICPRWMEPLRASISGINRGCRRLQVMNGRRERRGGREVLGGEGGEETVSRAEVEPIVRTKRRSIDRAVGGETPWLLDPSARRINRSRISERTETTDETNGTTGVSIRCKTRRPTRHPSFSSYRLLYVSSRDDDSRVTARRHAFQTSRMIRCNHQKIQHLRDLTR